MSEYSVEGKLVMRAGEPIAMIEDDGTLTYKEGYKRYAGPVNKALRAARGKPRKDEERPAYEQIPYDDIQRRYPDYKGPINPSLRDATPEFVWWLQRYYPAEANERYRGRNINRVPVYQPEPKAM